MASVAALLSVLGIIGLIWGFMQKFKAGRLAKAPFARTGEAQSKGGQLCGPKGEISAEGAVQCGELLTSPVTGTQCLYYEVKVVGTWKDGDSEKSKDYVDDKAAANFSIDDGSGPVAILAGEGGDFDPMEESFKETKKEGFFADLKSAVGKGEPIMFGQYAFANPPMSKANKFTCTEQVLKPQASLFALGKFDGGKIGPPKWTSLILSSKGREQLLGDTVKAAKRFIIGGAAVLAVGAVLGIVSNFVSDDGPDTVAGQTVESEVAPDEG